MTKWSQRSGYRESFMVSSNPCKLGECNSFHGTSLTDRLQVVGQTWLCFTRLQEVHTKANCESVSKFGDKLNVKSASSRSESEPCDNNGAVKKHIVAIELKSSTAVTNEFENDEVDQIDDGKVNICDNGHDRADLSLADHDETNGMLTSTDLNKSCVQLEVKYN
ncbi:unnamed protein product [Trichobilharzia regenti]|nr:unnamed protein product [Trichobilharzia regenti]